MVALEINYNGYNIFMLLYTVSILYIYTVYLVCASGEFQCLSGTCISHSLKCNGVKNCQYNEDELFCSK